MFLDVKGSVCRLYSGYLRQMVDTVLFPKKGENFDTF